MKRIAAAVALAVGLTVALTVTPAPAGAHTASQARAACNWIEVRTWGAPNQIDQAWNDPVHWFGSHQARCIYVGPNSTDHVCVIVDLINGHEEWSFNCLF